MAATNDGNRSPALRLLRPNPCYKQWHRNIRTIGQDTGGVQADHSRSADPGILDLHPELYDAGASAIAGGHTRDACDPDVSAFGGRRGRCSMNKAGA